MILIVSHADDVHATCVLGTLSERGADAVLFDLADFPLKTSIDVAAGDHMPRDIAITVETDDGTYDFDLVSAAYVLGMRKSDFNMAIQGLELRNERWPESRLDGYLKLGGIYTNQKKNDVKAAAAFKNAMELTPEKDREALRKQIPPQYLSKV